MSHNKGRLSQTLNKLSLKQAYSGWRNSWVGHHKRSSSTATSKQTEEKDDYRINMEGHVRTKSLHLSVHAESSLKKAVEAEQNTRRLTLEREERKQMILQKKKEEKRIFDIALLINDKTDEYYKILCGPVIYEVFYGYIRFADCQQYIQNDIHILNQTAVLMEELNSDDIFQYFCNYSSDPNDVQKGVTFHFADVSRCQLYKFNNKSLWDHHKRTQQNTSCDVFIVANHENIPVYIFLDVDINLIEQKIQFAEMHPYQKGDVHMLDQIGSKVMDFEVDKTFLFFRKSAYDMSPYNFATHTKAMFKFGICYRFSSKYTKNIFYHQSFNIALATNDNDEFLYLLTDVDYDLIHKSIAYKSCQFYRNGDYNRLRECGLEIKCIDINKFKVNRVDQRKYNLTLCRKCILFNLKNTSLWNAHIAKQKANQFDIATITDDNDYQTYILFDVTVNCIDQVIEYKICEQFQVQHHKIIEHYGELITTEMMSDFTVKGFEAATADALQNIFLYQLNSHSNGKTVNPKHRRKKSMKKKKKKRRQDTMISREDITGTKAKKEIHLSDEMNNIWNAYMDIYLFPPDNAEQLKAFSRLQNQTKTLSYSESRTLFKYHMKI